MTGRAITTREACIRQACNLYMLTTSEGRPWPGCKFPDNNGHGTGDCSAMCIPEIAAGEKLFQERINAARQT